MFKVTIDPGEAFANYGVDTMEGFTIDSKLPLSKQDFFTIRKIIGSFVELQRAREEHEIRTQKPKEFVACHKHDDQPKEPDYWNSLARLQDTAITMQGLKETFNIVQISTFRG